MNILVSNLGSTSFKFKLFEVSSIGSEAVLAEGAADRIGQGGSSWKVVANGATTKGEADLADHGAAIALLLGKVAEAGVTQVESLDAIGFKAVHGGPISGAVIVDDDVIATMQQFSDVAPAHNPPYINAMKAFAEQLPNVPQVAAFETAFHRTMPESRQVYGIPWDWTEMGVKRYGFHGASHRYIAERVSQIDPELKRIINFHLGGSCSVCAIKDGKSVATSMGTTPQSGLFHNNRVGDFDTFALLKLFAAGVTTDEVFHRLGKEGGLLGISGVSADMREVEEAAADGNERAQLALDAFVESCRDYLGAYLTVLGGADIITFTGGIGQHGKEIREAILRDMDWAGIVLDLDRNKIASGKEDFRIDEWAGDNYSNTQVWVLPTNEELIVARQTVGALADRSETVV
ncbi:MAG: acetate/propionate family kinase [Phycisphaera sp.]|nr:acetate/propionate family kinase [Phycisphaera sp.]